MAINLDIRSKLNPNTIVFDNQAYDSAIIGMTFDGRAIYSYELMVEELIDEGFSEQDALDWIDYNTIRALPYIGERAPLIVHEIL